MQIQILSVSVSSKPTKTGKSYQNAEVAYKNLESGKVESKNITQYSAVFKSVAEAASGTTAEVEQEKNSGGFWEWTSFKRVAATAAPAAPTVAEAVKQVKSQYETPEERAKKQVYIIKQSSLAQAVALLSVGAKTPPKTSEVLGLAQDLTDWVFGNEVLGDVPDFPSNLNVEVE